MNVRQRIRQWTRSYRRWRARIKVRKKERQHARITKNKKDVDKWNSDANLVNADYLDHKWEKSNPYCERKVYEYDCSCHGSNIKSVEVSNRKTQHNQQKQHQQIHSRDCTLLLAENKVPSIKTMSAAKHESNVELRQSQHDKNAPSNRNGFSTKHSKHTRQSWDYDNMRCDEHAVNCSCQITQRFSSRKEKEESLRKQKQWEKQKNQWKIQDSYGKAGSDYQLLDDDQLGTVVSDMQSDKRVLKDAFDAEWKNFVKTRALVRSTSLMSGSDVCESAVPKGRHSYHGNETNPQSGSDHHHVGCHEGCSCNIALQYSIMMDKKFGTHSNNNSSSKPQSKSTALHHHAYETNTAINKFNRSNSKKQEKRRSKHDKSKANDKVKEKDTNKKSIVQDDNCHEIKVDELQQKHALHKVTHEHGAKCSCKVVEEYSRKKDKEYEERRTKLNKQNIADNLFNAIVEKKTAIAQVKGDKAVSKQKSKPTKTSTPVRHQKDKSKSIINEKGGQVSAGSHSCDHGACSCSVVREFTLQKEKEYQEKRRSEYMRTKSESDALLRPSDSKNMPSQRKSTGGIVEKNVQSVSNAPELDIIIYKGYKKKSTEGKSPTQSDSQKKLDVFSVSQTIPDQPRQQLTPSNWASFDEPFAPLDIDSPPINSETKDGKRVTYFDTDSTYVKLDPDDWTPVKDPFTSFPDPANVKLDPKDWTPVKDPFTSLPDPAKVKLDPKDWTPVKDSVDSFPDSATVKLDPEDWTRVKESVDSCSDPANVKLDPRDWIPVKDPFNSFPDSATVKLDPEDWTPVKDPVDSCSDPSNVKLDSRDWTPVKKQVTSPVPNAISCQISLAEFCNSGEISNCKNDYDVHATSPASVLDACQPTTADVPHTAAQIYNQYAAQFRQQHDAAYLPVSEWTPQKQHHQCMNSQEITHDNTQVSTALFDQNPFNPFTCDVQHGMSDEFTHTVKSNEPKTSIANVFAEMPKSTHDIPNDELNKSAQNAPFQLPKSPTRDSCFAYNENAINELANVRKVRKKAKGKWSTLSSVLAKKKYNNLSEIPDDFGELYEEWEGDEVEQYSGKKSSNVW